jgi:eukaryotic-like serine/threonine-protein kinase
MTEALTSNTRAIGRYTILRELRRERHSVSYAAVDPVMNRQLVVKAVELLPAGPRLSSEERKRVEEAFVRQAQAAGRLQHPHIVTVFDAGLSHAFGFLVIERINGRPLHELLAGGLRPAFVQCASIGARIADAIECAHSNGVAHGHLGPQHVYLLADGSPKVSGFGGWIDDGASGDEALAGTARLLPYFQNEITEETRRSDVHAIGELLYMMLVGRAPPDGYAGSGAAASGSITLAARPETPSTLARIVDHALTGGDPGLRTAGAIRDALTSFIWNERTENVAPSTLGIPLAAPPQRAQVHVATIAPSDNVPPLRDASLPRAPAAMPAPAAPAARPAAPLPDPAAPGLLEVAKTMGIDIPALVERIRPWATRNRLPLFTAGALLSAGIFLGVLLGNIRHSEPLAQRVDSASVTPDATAAPVPASTLPGPTVPVSFVVRPWGEVFIDGKATGVAPPLAGLDLPTGRHHIEIRHANSPVWQTDLDVQGSTAIRIEHAFE